MAARRSRDVLLVLRICKAQQHCGAGSCQSDVEHGDRDLAAQQKRDGDPGEKDPDDPLDHDEAGQTVTVEIPDKAEQEAGQQAVEA